MHASPGWAVATILRASDSVWLHSIALPAMLRPLRTKGHRRSGEDEERGSNSSEAIRKSTHRVARVLLVLRNHRVVGQAVDESRGLLGVTTHSDDDATRPIGDSCEEVEERDLNEGPIVRQVSSSYSPRQGSIWAYAFFPTFEGSIVRSSCWSMRVVRYSLTC